MAYRRLKGRLSWPYSKAVLLRVSQVELDTQYERFAFLYDEERSLSISLLK